MSRLNIYGKMQDTLPKTDTLQVIILWNTGYPGKKNMSLDEV